MTSTSTLTQVVKSLSGLVFVAAALVLVVSVPFAIMMVEAWQDEEYHHVAAAVAGLAAGLATALSLRGPRRAECTLPSLHRRFTQ